jgi:hypothetical protein
MGSRLSHRFRGKTAIDVGTGNNPVNAHRTQDLIQPTNVVGVEVSQEHRVYVRNVQGGEATANFRAARPCINEIGT